ncbi:Fungal-specific transcription factor domain-containing protein [Madurella fahalii]|uniref:Fungal-specific transcription factor domain-containing protein n=1 Tax=Madurella fahalii TaxID=1157608 RepID=A0ABQ0GQ86_9PEZI
MGLTATTVGWETWVDTGGVDDASRTSADLGICCAFMQSRVEPPVRLSWPKAGDGKRAIVGKSPSPIKKRKGPHAHVARIVHVSHRDIEMHYYFAGSVANGRTQPSLDIPLAWNPRKLEAGHQDLFEYFQRTASRSLATFGYGPTELGNVLIRIALGSNKASATAVFQSLLAFSALHRHDVHSQAVELKISALKTLTAASGSDIGTMEAIHHVAAGMLLCSFEIHKASCTSGDWTWYLRGVKHVIQAAGLANIQHDNDLAVLLDWVYYHDVLARFSLRHWRRGSKGGSITTPSIRAEISQAAPPSLALIGLLSEVSDLIPARVVSTTTTEDAAGLKNLLTAIDKAFGIFATLGSCERQFPVFILGCEARNDDQRAVVLDLISRTEKNISSRSFNLVRLLLQALWAQDDLADGNTNYWKRLSYVISCCRIMPTFV